jgi:hypothetical protein
MLKTVADDHGYFRASPRLLLGQIYPHDRDLGEAAVNQMTAELVDAGCLELWQTPDGPIGRLVGWNDPRDAFYEHIARPSRSFLFAQLEGLQPVPGAVPGVLPLFGAPLHADVLHPHADVVQRKTRAEESGSQGVGESGSPGAEETPAADLTYTQQCTIAANTALGERLAGAYKPLVASCEAEAAGAWERDGVPIAVAQEAIREAVKRYRITGSNRQPNSLRYFDGAVREARERSLAKPAAVAVGAPALSLRRVDP